MCPSSGLDVMAKRKILPYQESNHGRPAHSLVAILTELFQLLLCVSSGSRCQVRILLFISVYQRLKGELVSITSLRTANVIHFHVFLHTM